MTCERIADLVDVYLDGEADALNARMVEEHVAECAGCGRKLAARRALQQALREKMTYFRAPVALRKGVVGGIGEGPAIRVGQRRFLYRFLYPVAAGVLIVVGMGLGYGLKGGGRVDPLMAVVSAAETDHLRSLQEGHLMDVASTDQHTVKPWFAGRVAFAPAVPDLKEFPLKGGRLDWMDGRQAVALVYGRNKHVINLFIWPASGGGVALPGEMESRGTAMGHHVVCWSAGGLNFCAVSDVEAGQLAEFAAAYRVESEPRPSGSDRSVNGSRAVAP